MKLQTLALLLLSSTTSADNSLRQTRLGEEITSNDNGMDWFVTESIKNAAGDYQESTPSSRADSTLEPTKNRTSRPSSRPRTPRPSNARTSRPTHRRTAKPSRPPTPTPTESPTPSPTSFFKGQPSLPILSRMGCPSGQRKIRFAINLDKWGKETTWEIKQLRTNDIVLRNSRTYTEYDEEILDKCVDSGEPEEQYELSVYDEVGDGICCKSGQGSYTLSIEESGGFYRLVSGGNFKKKYITHLVSVRSKSPELTPREEEWLVAHNTRREYWHEYYGKSYVPLKWSGELAASSKAYAEKLLSTCDDSGIEHDPFNTYGENMAKNKGTGGWGALYPADKVTGRFIDREVEIGYPNNYHLTQALWRASRYVGCGDSEMEWNGGTCRIQVCRYSKAGNCDMSRDNWEEKMMEDDSGCMPDCPPEGCF